MMNNVFCCCVRRNHNQLTKLYDKGSEKLEKSLDIVHIIKNLRKLKILVKNKFLDKDTHFKLNHNNKNIIDLECTTSSSEDDENKRKSSIGGENMLKEL